jgi:cation:H+ antiporter
MPLFSPEEWSLLESSIAVGICAAAIALVGTRLTRVVDQLADRTGLGEAVAGAVLLGAATSFSGIVVSVTAAAKGNPELAISNALGGIAVQTFFLVTPSPGTRSFGSF